jgi:glycine hydroxymethyltransferase
MAEALLRRRLDEAGVSAGVSSAGLLGHDVPASDGAVRVLAARGIDLAAHRSRRLSPELVAGADLVVGMAQNHVREAVLAVPDSMGRAFTLKELVRRGEAVGPRGGGETLADWLGRVGAGRRHADLLGDDPADAVADPIGLPDKAYRAAAEEIDELLRRLVELTFPPPGDDAMTAGPEAGDVRATDPELFDLVDRELERQNTTLQLIASENFTSPAVLAATGSVLTNKYSEGYPGRRYYGGNSVIDEVENLARDRAKALFGAEHANVQPHSGSNANAAVYLALLEPGDTVMGMRLDHGGHLTHGSPVNFSGQLYRFVSYGLAPSDERIDLDQVRDLARAEHPKLIVVGATAYPRRIEPEPFRAIADEVGALLMFDAAHVAGLIAGGVHPDPVPFADVVTLTTHKTLRGPRGGCILSTEALAAAIDKAVMPGLQGGPLDHVVAAKAVAFREASTPAFRLYARAIVDNAAAFADALSGEGFRLVSGGTDNHLLLLDLRPFDADLTGKAAQEVLDRAGITTNRNTIPDDPRSPFVGSGLRLGTAAMTTTGMGPAEMAVVARLLARALRHREDEDEVRAVGAEVGALCARFVPYPSGDDRLVAARS